MNKKLTLSIFLILSLNISFAQNKEYRDSLKLELDQELSDSARMITLHELAKAIRYDKPDSALLVIYQAKNINESVNDSLFLMEVKTTQGKIYDNQSKFDSALILYFEVLDYHKLKSDTLGIASMLNNIGIIYGKRQKTETSLKYYEESLALRKALKDSSNIALLFNNLGIANKKLGRYEKALKYYNDGLDYLANENPWALNMALLNGIGNVFYEKKEYVKSVEAHFKAFDVLKEVKPGLYFEAVIQTDLGEALIKTGDLVQARKYLNISLNIAQQLKDTQQEQEIYTALVEIDEQTGNYKSAFNNFKKLTARKDSVFSFKQESTIAELEKKYQTVEKEKELTQKKLEIAQQKDEIEKDRLYIGLLLSISILVIITAIIFFRGKQQLSLANKNLLQRKEEIKAQAEEIKTQNAVLSTQKEELEASYEKIVELDNFKESMSGMIVHDLKNLLNVVINLSVGEMNEFKSKSIHQSGLEMLNMVTDILDIYRYENIKLPLNKSNFNVNQLINSALTQISFLIENKRIKLNLAVEVSSSAYADFDLMVRVLVNFFTNAIKFTQSHGKIDCSVNEEDTTIRFILTDTGSGIPKDKIDLIFEKFGQVEAKKLGLVQSTGLGLTFCKMVIEAHGGNIEVYSKEGEGTSFVFSIPKGAPVKDNEVIVVEEKSKAIKLKHEDIEQINRILPELLEKEIYLISEIKEILSRLDFTESENLKIWHQQIENAIYESDERVYNELLGMVNSN